MWVRHCASEEKHSTGPPANVRAFSTVIVRQSRLLKSISDNVTGTHRAPTELSVRSQLNAASTSAAFCKKLVFAFAPFVSALVISSSLLSISVSIAFLPFFFFFFAAQLYYQHSIACIHGNVFARVCTLGAYVCAWSACVASCPRQCGNYRSLPLG